GEYAFQLKAYIPDEYLTGMLLEDWVITPEKTIWHVRPGIYWAADNVDWMDNRELIAQDVVEDLLIFRDCAAGGWAFRGMTEADGIYATDRYTLVIETPGGFDLTMMYIIGYEDRSLFTPPEMEVAPGGAASWANQVGTGPFMLKEYVVGSHMTYIPNPNYWDTTTIDGVEYQIPFVDEMIYPIVPDPSSLMSALRTGVADFCGPGTLGSEYWPALEQTAPGLLSATYPVPEGGLLGLKV
ncbi:unnamed protein product, partial [marine sediment metagenome]